jgi:hypothetical protein
MRLFTSTFLIIAFLAVIIPLPVLGAGCATPLTVPPTTFAQTLCLGSSLVRSVIPIIVAATLLVFIFGLIKFMRASGDSKAIEEGKTFMIWGIIALFVMLSIWGILNLFYSDFFGGTVGVPQLPEPKITQ